MKQWKLRWVWGIILTLAGLGFYPAEHPRYPMLVILNKSDHTAILYRPDTGAVLATVPTGRGPHEVAVSPDGRYAYVANYGTRDAPGHTLTVIDLVHRKVVDTIDLSPYRRPHGITTTTAGQVVVTCEANRALVVVDPQKRRIVFTVDTGQQVSHMVVLTPDDRWAYVANIGDGSVTVIDLAARRRVKIIPVDAGTEGITVAPNGRFVYVTNRAADTIAAIDTETQTVVRKAKTCAVPIRIQITPDGQNLLVSCFRAHRLVLHDALTLKPLRTLEVGAGPIGVLIEPDGTRAYVAYTQQDRVGVLDLGAWKIVATIPTGDEPDGMAWAMVPAKSIP